MSLAHQNCRRTAIADKRLDGDRIWFEAEISLLRDTYPSRPWPEVLAAIPSKTRIQIKNKAYALGITRNTGDRVKLPLNISDEERVSLTLEKQRDASARWRAAHRDKYLASMREYDARPERKKAKATRAAKERKSDEYRDRIREYRARPDVRARDLDQQRVRRSTPEFKAKIKEHRSNPSVKRRAADRQRAIRQTPEGMLNNRMRSAIRRGLAQGVGFSVASKSLGYNLADIRIHIEKQFLDGMSWDNAHDWHIDHIIPLSHFSFESVDDDGFKAAWSLTNLRPVWATDNLKKSDKILSLL